MSGLFIFIAWQSNDYDTGGRGRTDTPVKERDFESRASANSATPAKLTPEAIVYGFQEHLLLY